MELPPETLDRVHGFLAEKFGRSVGVVKKTLALLDEGNTIPFIARYRKDVTGTMDEVQLRDLQGEYTSLVNLEKRRSTILKSIDEQGKLTADLARKINEAVSLTELEDLYLPYKPKRRTKAQKAREAGLEPLFEIIFHEQPVEGDKEEIASRFLNPDAGINTPADALGGAVDIIVETIAEDAEIRKVLRNIVAMEAVLKCSPMVPDEPNGSNASGDAGDLGGPGDTGDGAGRVAAGPGNRGNERNEGNECTNDREKYRDYFDFEMTMRKLKPYQVLAINRGENEGYLDVELSINDEEFLAALKGDFIKTGNTIFLQELERGITRGFGRVSRTIKREEWVRTIMEAKSHAIKVFARNLKNLLMQPPLKGRNIVAIDPGYRNGCKVAVIGANGQCLDHVTVYPHAPRNKRDEARRVLLELAKKHDAWTFAIGNGTASRETELLVAGLSSMPGANGKVEYTIVNEAGASVYSASDIARKELPDLDVSIRGAVSIGRRLQDPLPELIKIDPKSIGVGLYQHDVNQSDLGAELDAVIEDCVNKVGVDVNTASEVLLKRVSGLNSRTARSIVEYREKIGGFTNREQLKDVPFIGEKTYEQAIGFLKIYDGDNPLDSTFIHPESYPVAVEILDSLGMSPADLANEDAIQEIRKLLSEKGEIERLERQFGDTYGQETLKDIIAALKAPRRDPRDDLPPVVLRGDVLSIEDLKPGMILKGTVRNVVDFGAFVDIGVKHDGLVHISEIADTFVRNPHEYLAAGDVIDVMVIGVDLPRHRIQLSMKQVKQGGKGCGNETTGRVSRVGGKTSKQGMGSLEARREPEGKRRRESRGGPHPM